MKITHVAIATAALAFGSAAVAQEEVQGSTDCAALQAQYDQAAAAATAEQLSRPRPPAMKARSFATKARLPRARPS